MSEVLTVAVDDGSSQCKLAYKNGDVITTAITTSILSQHSGFADDSIDESLFSCNGMNFLVGDYVRDPYNNNGKSFQNSEIARVGVQNALIKAGFGGKDIKLCVTLPISDYYNTDGINKENIENKIKNYLTLDVENISGLPVANIKEVKVFSESKPAFVSYFQKLGIKPSAEDMYAIIDIGDTTCDVSTFYGDGKMSKNGFKTLRAGVSLVKNEVADHIKRNYNVSGVSASVLSRAIQTGRIKFGRFDDDFKSELKNIVKRAASKLIVDIERVLIEPELYKDIIIVGGGAKVYESAFVDWGHSITIPDNHVTALAESILEIELSMG